MVQRYSTYGCDWECETYKDERGELVAYDDFKAVVDKANELLREAANVYRMYNKTQEPDGNLVDMQTLQELSDLING